MGNSAVLLVEDNDINRDMLARRLTRAGLTVITAADGISALEMMREHQPGVVLMDMTLPILDGWEATQKAKKDPVIAEIPIIALTAVNAIIGISAMTGSFFAFCVASQPSRIGNVISISTTPG